MTEWEVRCSLAALYRIIDICGWADSIYTHISARIPGTDFILLNQYGLLNEEITASNLVKVPLSELATYDVNIVGYNIHSAIHNARPSVNFIIHTHSPDIVAVSSQKSGLLPIAQQSVFIMNTLSYHTYEGIFFWEEEKAQLLSDLGDTRCMLLRNHGSIVVGDSAESVFFYQYMLDAACKIQIKSGIDNVNLISNEAINRTISYTGGSVPKQKSTPLLWNAMLRKLNKINPGYNI